MSGIRLFYRFYGLLKLALQQINHFQGPNGFKMMRNRPLQVVESWILADLGDFLQIFEKFKNRNFGFYAYPVIKNDYSGYFYVIRSQNKPPIHGKTQNFKKSAFL